jgi:hypothetical protein
MKWYADGALCQASPLIPRPVLPSPAKLERGEGEALPGYSPLDFG